MDELQCFLCEIGFPHLKDKFKWFNNPIALKQFTIQELIGMGCSFNEASTILEVINKDKPSKDFSTNANKNWSNNEVPSSAHKIESSELLDEIEMLSDDIYKTFGVSSKATSAEIKTRYYHLMKENHPDKNPFNTDIEHLKNQTAVINKIYSILKDDDLRRKYDSRQGSHCVQNDEYSRLQDELARIQRENREREQQEDKLRRQREIDRINKIAQQEKLVEEREQKRIAQQKELETKRLAKKQEKRRLQQEKEAYEIKKMVEEERIKIQHIVKQEIYDQEYNYLLNEIRNDLQSKLPYIKYQMQKEIEQQVEKDREKIKNQVERDIYKEERQKLENWRWKIRNVIKKEEEMVIRREEKEKVERNREKIALEEQKKPSSSWW